MVESDFFTVVEVARRLSVRVETLRSWLTTGKLRGVKLPGGDWRVRPEDLDIMFQSPVVKVGDAREA
jgi:excisionase family DNA binding protein